MAHRSSNTARRWRKRSADSDQPSAEGPTSSAKAAEPPEPDRNPARRLKAWPHIPTERQCHLVCGEAALCYGAATARFVIALVRPGLLLMRPRAARVSLAAW